MQNTLLLTLALFAGPVDQNAAPENPRSTPEWVASAAAALADTDGGAPSVRFVVCRDSSELAAVSFVVNAVVSHSPNIQRLRAVAPDVYALDLATLECDGATWETLANNEPYFHERTSKLETVKPFVHTDGKTYNQRRVWHNAPAERLGADLVALSLATSSNVPIVRGDWLVSILSQNINGGRYYAFRRLTAGKTTLDTYLDSRGTSRKQAERLRVDERIGLLSAVTAKPRAIQLYQSSGTRATAGPSYTAITEDPFDENLDQTSDSFRQLIDLRSDGREVMVSMPNGLIEWTLFDGAGALVNSAPDNLVRDHKIPAPYTARLNGLISCVRCHGPNNGWQPAANEVLTGRADLAGGQQLVAALAARYAYDPADMLETFQLARSAFSKNVFQATRMDAREASAAVASVFDAYEYQTITIAQAAREVGLKDVSQMPQIVGADDPVILRLYNTRLDLETGKRVGLRITRRQFEQVYDSLAKKVTRNE
jgi:hypothetical protein